MKQNDSVYIYILRAVNFIHRPLLLLFLVDRAVDCRLITMAETNV